jgi:hypothetical protein
MTLLVTGCMAIAVLLILGTIVATSAQLARVQLLDVVDGAALDAADALDSRAYERGLDDAVVISDSTVRESAAGYLQGRDRPSRVTAWALDPGTGTPDGTTAVVVLVGRVELPVVGPLLQVVGSSVTITVTGSARAGLVG